MAWEILHIITGLNDGGAEAVLYRLCGYGAKPERHAVVSLSPAGKYSEPLEALGVTVHHLDMPRGRVTLTGLYRLYCLLRRHKPQSVQTWMYHADLVGGVVARLAGVPYVFWGLHHTDLIPGASGRSTRIVAGLCARLSRFVPARIVACAERARIVHIALGYDAKKFVVIPNGYDIDAYAPDPQAGEALRRQLAPPTDGPVIGLVGRWNAQKDHANLVAAFERVLARQPCARLVLVGTDCAPDNPALVDLLEGAGLSRRVHLLGRRDDIPAVMNALDLHVLSSSHGEAFPNVVAEAMACGTPCVVTNVGDAALIVGETGWVVTPRDSEALANAILSALAEKERKPHIWSARQHSARQRVVDKFSLATMVEAYETIWRST
jgi:glycosyltransferase involved in cell wall biosynthesis